MHKTLETVSEEEAVKLGGHDQFDHTGIYGMDRNLESLNQDFMPNCPQPNITYNGSLLSSGKVATFNGPNSIAILYQTIYSFIVQPKSYPIFSILI